MVNLLQRSLAEEVFSYITYIMGVVLICVLAIGIGVCVGKLTYRRKIRLKQSKGN